MSMGKSGEGNNNGDAADVRYEPGPLHRPLGFQSWKPLDAWIGGLVLRSGIGVLDRCVRNLLIECDYDSVLEPCKTFSRPQFS